MFSDEKSHVVAKSNLLKKLLKTNRPQTPKPFDLNCSLPQIHLHQISAPNQPSNPQFLSQFTVKTPPPHSAADSVLYFYQDEPEQQPLRTEAFDSSEKKSHRSTKPNVRGPSNYSREPPRHLNLKINAKIQFQSLFFFFFAFFKFNFSSRFFLISSISHSQEPFNAEPPRAALGAAYVTPVDLFYKRNHGLIPIVDDVHSYSTTISGLIENLKQLFFKDITALPKDNVTATLQAVCRE